MNKEKFDLVSALHDRRRQPGLQLPQADGEAGTSTRHVRLSAEDEVSFLSKMQPLLMSGKRQGCVINVDNCKYTIVVASPPEGKQGETAEPLLRASSLTIVKKNLMSSTKSSGSVASDTTAGDGGSVTASGSTMVPALIRSASSGRPMFTVSDDENGPGRNESVPRSGILQDLASLIPMEPTDRTVTPHGCSLKLRHLLNKLESDNESSQQASYKQELVDGIEFAIRILDTVATADEIRNVVVDDEDEFSKVETEAVPNEVRDWLALTFTRGPTASAAKRKDSDNKPRFRSVANVIRAGILVDKIYRRMSSSVGLHIPPKIVTLFKNLEDWSFNVFTINDISDGHTLKYIGFELLQRYDLINKFKINTQTLENFLLKLEQGYSKFSNPYHNLIHAADVTQTMHHIVSRSGLSTWLSDLDLFAAVVAALIHDFEHTGTTNTFHINTSSDFALLYNDKAVLENHHLSASFRLLKDADYNIVSGLKRDDYKEFRSLVIEIVLATDMSFHFQQIKNMKSMLSVPESIDKTKALSLIVHCADISHPAKDWNLHHRWTELLMEEFFRQGDRESNLGLLVSPLCDRKTTLVAESQIGFIDFIVDPSLQVMGDMIEKVMKYFQDQSQQNLAEETNGSISSPSSNSNINSYFVMRPWESCLVYNKQKWRERVATADPAPSEDGIAAAEAASGNGVIASGNGSPGIVRDSSRESSSERTISLSSDRSIKNLPANSATTCSNSTTTCSNSTTTCTDSNTTSSTSQSQSPQTASVSAILLNHQEH